MRILLGHDATTRRALYFPVQALQRHLHLIGYTGSGKTTAIVTLLEALLGLPVDRCVVIIDRLGGFSLDLLRWFASEFCPQWVRQRLVYIEPAREDVVLGFNPLLHETPGEGYYKVSRAAEIILRAWESVNIEAMPRLARSVLNAFWAAPQRGLPIADRGHLFMPGNASI